MTRWSAPLAAAMAIGAGLVLGGCTAPPSTTIVHDTQTVSATPSAAPTVTETVTASASASTASSSAGTGTGTGTGTGGIGWRGTGRTAGCPGNGGEIPEGARSIGIADVDGDGQQDALVIDDAHVEVGVLTHSGRLVMTRALWGPGPAAHSVSASYLSDGVTALLADDSRDVDLGYFADCAITVPKGVDGKPYVFALFGWGAYDAGADHLYNAGVRCTALADSGGQHTLSGVDLLGDRSLFRIRTTVVSTANRGVTAVNGRVSTTPGAYGKDDATVQRAKSVDCGPRVTAPSE